MQYVYCVAALRALAAETPDGLDGGQTRVAENADAGLCALASELDASEYAAERVSEMMLDADWLAPRAIGHDAVVTWAADRADVVPLPMWVMFSDTAAVERMLAERAEEFQTALRAISGAREFGVRVCADAAAIAALVARLDGSLSDLEHRASVAPPGQAYLLRRKLAEQHKIFVRDVAGRTADDIHSRLSSQARANSPRASAVAKEPGVLLDGAYLVDDAKYDLFRSLVTDVMDEYQADGLRFEFTGPWPPYHFVHAS